jgi:hypothetical protein
MYLNINLAVYRWETFLSDSPVLVHWSSGYYTLPENKNMTWIANKVQHTIKLLENSKIIFNKR